MVNYFVFIVISLSCNSSVISAVKVKKITMNVYYESLCPYSKMFILDQLSPVYNSMASWVKLKLIPFGNAEVSGQHNEYTFECQHGPTECQGNMIQACGIHTLKKTKEKLKFVACAFKYPVEQALEKCVDSDKTYNQILQCTKGSKGKNLLYKMGKLTHSLKPFMDSVPWITINGVGDKYINELSKKNLKNVLCKLYKVGGKYINGLTKKNLKSAFCKPHKAKETVSVSVYYESLCPDSRKFVLNQLEPVYKKIANNVVLKFIPYGNAETKGKHDAYTFTCQHGPEECRGNTIQVCAIQILNNTEEKLKFISCAFHQSSQHKIIEQCAHSDSIKNKIEQCADGPMGNNLLYEMGVLTNSLSPGQTFIPWITFNGKGGDKINKEANDNFVEKLCEFYKNDIPDFCQFQKKKMTDFYHRLVGL